MAILEPLCQKLCCILIDVSQKVKIGRKKKRHVIYWIRDVSSTQLSYVCIFIVLFRVMILLPDFLAASSIPIALASVDTALSRVHMHENNLK